MTEAMKRALATALFALLALLSAGAPSPRRIHLWHAYRDDELAALVAILAQWKGEPVDAVSIPYDAYNAKLAAAIPLGDGPDLFIAEHKYLGDFRYRKLVAPVGDALEPGVFSAPALAAVREGDVAWAVPLSNKCVALYVNTDLAARAPADLEGMVDLVGALPPGVVPLAFETRNAYYVAAILSAFGGALLDDHDRFGLIGPDAVRAVELDRWLIEQRAAPEDADGALVTQLFGSGQAAFAISGPWLAASLGGKGLHYRVEQLPLRARHRPADAPAPRRRVGDARARRRRPARGARAGPPPRRPRGRARSAPATARPPPAATSSCPRATCAPSPSRP